MHIDKRRVARRAILAGFVGTGLLILGCDVHPQTKAAMVDVFSPSVQEAKPGQTLKILNDASQSNFTGFSSVAWSPAGKYIATGGLGKRAILWDIATGQIYRTMRTTAESGTLCWSPDGRYVAMGGGDYSAYDTFGVWIWDTQKDRVHTRLAGHMAHVNAVAWSPDGTRLASASDDQTVRIWDAHKGQLVRTYHAHATPVSALAWSPDSIHLISSMNDLAGGVSGPTVRVWNSRNGRDVFFYKGTANALAWATNNAAIATGESYGIVHMRSVANGDVFATYKSGYAPVLALAWSPDNSRIVICGGSTQSFSNDGFAYVRSLATGNVLVYQGHKLAVLAAVWSPDGTRIVSSSYDGTAKIWQAL